MADTDKALLVSADMEGWLASTGFAQFSPDPSITNKRFLYQWLRSDTFVRAKESLCVGSTQRAINQTDLASIPVDFPSLPIQEYIAGVLATVDDAIAQSEALIAKTQSIKAGLLHDLFTRGVKPDGQLRPSREEAPKLYKESPVGWIPKEWDTVALRDLAAPTANSFVNGPFGSNLLSSELQESGVPVIYVQDVKRDGFRKISFAHVTEHKANELAFCNVHQGDVVVAKVGTPPGDAAVYQQPQRAIITQDVIRIRPAPDVASEYLAGLLNSSVGSRVIRRIMIEGTRGRVSLTDFKRAQVSKPPLSEQKLFAIQIIHILAMIDTLNHELQKQREIKAGLMHDLLAGRVCVPIDERKKVMA